MRRWEGADVVTARAVAPLARLAGWCLPLVRPGGLMLVLKGESRRGRDRAGRRPPSGALGGRIPRVVRCGVGVVDPPSTVVVVERARGAGAGRTPRRRRASRRDGPTCPDTAMSSPADGLAREGLAWNTAAGPRSRRRRRARPGCCIPTGHRMPRPVAPPRADRRQPEGRRRQDDEHGQPGRGAGHARRAGAGHRPRPAGQRQHGARRRAPLGHAVGVRGAARRDRRWPTRRCRARRRPNLLCVPATIDLAGAEIELVSMVAREHRLKQALTDEALDELDVDYVFIDCPPSLGLLTVNALVAADEVLIPIQCEYYALEGLGQLLSNIDLVRSHLNTDAARLDDPADDVRRPHQAGRPGHQGGAQPLRPDRAAHGDPPQREGLRGARATARRCSPTTRARAAR